MDLLYDKGQSGIRAIKALGTIMVNLAQMTAALGSLRTDDGMRGDTTCALLHR